MVTIEGNTSDAVHSRSYTMGSSYVARISYRSIRKMQILAETVMRKSLIIPPEQRLYERNCGCDHGKFKTGIRD